MHDDLGASISAIKLIITNSYPDDQSLVKMINRASTDLRAHTNQYGQELVNKNGLFDSLRQRIGDLNEVSPINFEMITSGNDQKLEATLSISIFRMASELLTNIIKHSAATAATIQLIIDDTAITLMCEDNGHGFDKDTEHKGIGLESIETRAQRFGGEVHITSNKHTGTTSIINIPLKNDC